MTDGFRILESGARRVTEGDSPRITERFVSASVSLSASSTIATEGFRETFAQADLASIGSKLAAADRGTLGILNASASGTLEANAGVEGPASVALTASSSMSLPTRGEVAETFDFSGFSVGPYDYVDWTGFFNDQGQSEIVEDNADGLTGNVLRTTRTGNLFTTAHGMLWTAAEVEDAEKLTARVLLRGTNTKCGIALDAGSTNGYCLAIDGTLYRTNGNRNIDSWTTLGSFSSGGNTSNVYWAMLQWDDGTLRAKIWRHSSSEPASWQIEVEDDAYVPTAVGAYGHRRGQAAFVRQASFASEGVLIAKETPAIAGLEAVAGFGASALMTRAASLDLHGTGSFAVSGIRTTPGQADLVADGSKLTAAFRQTFGVSPLTAHADLVTAGFVFKDGEAGFSASGTLDIDGFVTRLIEGSVSLSASGTMSGPGLFDPGLFDPDLFDATGEVNALVTRIASVTLTGIGSVDFVPEGDFPAAANANGTGTIQAAAVTTLPASVDLQSTGSKLTAAVRVTYAIAALMASGFAAAAAERTTPATAGFTATSVITAQQAYTARPVSSLAGQGSLAASGLVVRPAFADFAASGSKLSAVGLTRPVMADAVGTSSLSAIPKLTISATAATTALGGLSAEANLTLNGAFSGSATGSIHAVGGFTLAASANLGDGATDTRITEADDRRITEDGDVRVVLAGGPSSRLAAEAEVTLFVGGISTKLASTWFPVDPLVRSGGVWVPVQQAYAFQNGRWFRCY